MVMIPYRPPKGGVELSQLLVNVPRRSGDTTPMRLNEYLDGIIPVGAHMFGVKGSKTASQNATALQEAIDYCETLEEEITVNYDRIRAALILPPEEIDCDPVDAAQVRDGLVIQGHGMGQTIVHYTGSGTLFTVGTEVSAPNFSHIWFRDFTVRGNESAIVANSQGIEFNRCIRACGLERMQLFGFDKCVKLNDCWTFEFLHCHMHDASKNHINWQTALGGLIWGGRYDDAGEDCVSIDAQGASNQVRALKIGGGAIFQEASRSAIRGSDLTQLDLDTCFFERNNQDDGGYADVRLLDGTSTRKQGILNARNCYHSPNAGWTGINHAMTVEGFRVAQLQGVMTGSSSYDYYLECDDAMRYVEIAGVFVNIPNNTAVDAAGSETMIREHWVEIDGSDNVTQVVHDDGAEYGEIVNSTVSLNSNANARTYNIGGSSPTLTLRDEDAIKNRVIEVYFYGSGTLKVTPAVTTSIKMSLDGSTNNVLQVSSSGAKLRVTFSGTNWIATPENGSWSLSAT